MADPGAAVATLHPVFKDGRPPADDRVALDGILFVLQMGLGQAASDHAEQAA